ncbi:MAG: hemerythrin domain-containing protein [Desulfosarcinaceae bacterium]
MRPEENLREDHGQIMKLFVTWQNMLEKLDRKDQALLEDLEKCIDWVEVFVDRCHHGKEDEILFPAMASSEDPEVTRLIKDLHSEHQTGRSLLESIKLEINGLSQPNGLSGGLIQLSRGYIDLFRKHIRRENAQLLPLIEKCIPIEDQERIIAQFGQYEQRTIGIKKSIPD